MMIMMKVYDDGIDGYDGGDDWCFIGREYVDDKTKI